MTAGGCRSKPPTFLKQVWHRIVGVRGSDGGSGIMINGAPFDYPSTATAPSSSVKSSSTSMGNSNTTSTVGNVMNGSNFGKFASTKDIADHRLVFLGEIHSMPPIIAFQRQIQHEMLQIQKCHLIHYHFPCNCMRLP